MTARFFCEKINRKLKNENSFVVLQTLSETMDVKTKVLSRAAELYLQIGIRNVTMDFLAADLGMSKRTIYEFFGQKDALVIETLHFMIRMENEETIRLIESAENVVEALYLIIKRKKELRGTHPVVFLEDVKRYIPQLLESLFLHEDDLRKNSPSYLLLERGIKEGIFRKSLDLKLVDSFLQELITVVHTSQRILLLKAEGHQLLENIFIPYFRGICTQKGINLMNDFFNLED